MSRRNPQALAKRERERTKAKKRQEKMERRAQRKALREKGTDERKDGDADETVSPSLNDSPS